jgi:hypothetical protein
MGSDDDDIDLREVDKWLCLHFKTDMVPYLFAPVRTKVVEEAPCYPEGTQLVPVDRVYIIRKIRDQFGECVARAVMDYPIFTLH